jgi:putative salt-induced outer membrane protein
MFRRALLCVPLLLCSPFVMAQNTADPAAMSSPWSGSGGEFGFASAHGNSTTESFNGRLKLRHTDDDWVHSMDLFALRSSAQYTETADDGSTTRKRQTTANRYSATAGSALQLGEYRQITATVRLESDDFATYDRQSSFGLGYGTRLIDGERVSLDAQIGPGVRRSHNADTDQTRTEFIGRGLFDLKFSMTDNTDLFNTLLVESGSYNTFAQNDFGLAVNMNKHFALKAGWQARHNSDVSNNKRKTDTLTTMNVVYSFK